MEKRNKTIITIPITREGLEKLGREIYQEASGRTILLTSKSNKIKIPKVDDRIDFTVCGLAGRITLRFIIIPSNFYWEDIGQIIKKYGKKVYQKTK